MLESCEESSQWLNRSQLYFLTHNTVSMNLRRRLLPDNCLSSVSQSTSSSLQDLMTFTTKAEEEKLMASSKQVQLDEHSPQPSKEETCAFPCVRSPVLGGTVTGRWRKVDDSGAAQMQSRTMD